MALVQKILWVTSSGHEYDSREGAEEQEARDIAESSCYSHAAWKEAQQLIYNNCTPSMMERIKLTLEYGVRHAVGEAFNAGRKFERENG